MPAVRASQPSSPRALVHSHQVALVRARDAAAELELSCGPSTTQLEAAEGRGATRRQGARDGSCQLPDLRPRLLPPDPPTQANPGYLAPRQPFTRAAEALPPLHLLGPRAPGRRLRRARGRFGLRHHGDRPRARRRSARHAPPRQQSARAARPPRGRVLRRTPRRPRVHEQIMNFVRVCLFVCSRQWARRGCVFVKEPVHEHGVCLFCSPG
eukprot:scaffold28824_cov101-Phaeocystis_antarctica.AAC.4